MIITLQEDKSVLLLLFLFKSTVHGYGGFELKLQLILIIFLLQTNACLTFDGSDKTLK